MSSRYRELLARPMIISPDTSPEEIASTFHERMRALFKLYRIDPDHEHSERHLLRALITRHVPGFRVKQQAADAKSHRRGRPAALNVVQRVKLQNKMDRLIAKGIRKPASWLGADPDFAGVNPETLRRTHARDRSKYRKHKDPIVGIANEFILEVSTRLKLQKKPEGAFGSIEPVKTRAKKTH